VLVRDDWGILDVTWGSALGLAEAADVIWRKSSEWIIPQERITYDRVGIGRDFPLHLARHGLQRCVGYAGSGSPQSKDFANLRSEAAWKLRKRLDAGLPGDPSRPYDRQAPFSIPAGAYWNRLRDELKVLTYELAGRKTKLLPKDKWSEAVGHSPDIADALIQSFAF
jgi:hypothetical protein